MVEPSTALILAWLASKSRSLFAAQCLVDTVLQLYLSGNSLSDIQLTLRMGNCTSTPPPLSTEEEDVLVTYLSIIVLTLEELGVQQQGYLTPSQQEQQQMLELRRAGRSEYLGGMAGFVTVALKGYDEGSSLAGVGGLQALTRQSTPGQQSLLLMQLYSRLVLITVEVVAAEGLPCLRQLQPPTIIKRATGYSLAFSASCQLASLDPECLRSVDDSDSSSSDCESIDPLPLLPSSALQEGTITSDGQAEPDVGSGVDEGSSSSSSSVVGSSSGAFGVGGGSGVFGGSSSSSARCPPQGLAIRLLVSFMGAVLGSNFSLNEFAVSAYLAYVQGRSATFIASQLSDSDYDQAGGLLPVALPADGHDPRAAQRITQELFTVWLSTVYLSLAEQRVVYPGERKAEVGWAWAGPGDAVEASAMHLMVQKALSRAEEADAIEQMRARGSREKQAGILRLAQGQEPAGDGVSGGNPSCGGGGSSSNSLLTAGDVQGTASGSAAAAEAAAAAAEAAAATTADAVAAAEAAAAASGEGLPATSESRSEVERWEGGGSQGDSVSVDGGFVTLAGNQRDPLQRWKMVPGIAAAFEESFATRADDDKQHLLAATRNVQAQQEVIAEFAQLGTMGGKQMPSVLVKIEDQQLRHTSSAVAIMIKQVSLVDITYQLVKKAMAGEL
ncbi:MAG: hypothetical protein WDW36_001655 [Sanguina aurantia]